VGGRNREVRITPESRLNSDIAECPKGANSGSDRPKAEHGAEWQAAMRALLLVAEHDGPAMFARIGVIRALNRHVERVFNPSRKEPHWGRRKLARDR
jgi:hypothetical protein